MAKGQRTKAGHIIQMIHHGADPNRFNPNGKRVVCHNAEDYDYIEGIEFDKLTRKGAKALVANVPLEEMWTGKISGPLHYNLMDDQIFPFWIAKGVETPVTVDGINCIDTVYERPQLDRADRAFFSIEEGKPGQGADLGCYGMFTSFKWTSKRGNKGKSRFEVGFATQAAVPRPALTGGAAQNHKTRITAANVAGPIALAVTNKNISLAIGDTVAQIVAKFATEGFAINAAGTIAQGAVERHSVTGNGNTFTIYGDIVVNLAANPTPTLGTIQTAIRAKAGRGSAVVDGVLTAPAPIVTQGAAISQDAGNGANWTGATGAYKAVIAWTEADGHIVVTPVVTINATNGVRADKLQLPPMSIQAGGASETRNNITLYISDAAGSNTMRKSAAAYDGYGFSPVSPAVAGQPIAPVVGPATAGSATLTVTYDAAAGNVADIEAVPGAGYVGNSVQPGGAGGTVVIEFTNPGNTAVSVVKTGGDAGYSVQTVQYGGDGSILGAMRPEDPIIPGHLFLYSADTPTGLEDEANLVGQIGEWDIDDPKICLPVSHHVRVNDPERPNLPTTYNAHAEEESEEDGIKLSITMDADENGAVVDGMKALLRASGKRLVSVPRYWRIAAIHPGSPQRVFLDFYGSVGASVPISWAGSVEQYKFVYDLLENKTATWNFKAKTRRLV